MAKAKPSTKYPERAADVPVTQRMLYAVRDEFKSDLKAMDAKFDGKFSGVDGKLNSIDGRFAAIDGRLNELEVKLEGKLESRFYELSSQIHQIKILVEEQNAKNNIVLDGLTSLFARQERIELRVDRLESEK